jgi:hypothetical protein
MQTIGSHKYGEKFDIITARLTHHELALDVGISNSLAGIAFHQTDVARGVLHVERLHTPATADAARPLLFSFLGVSHQSRNAQPQQGIDPCCSIGGQADDHPK